MSMYPMMRLGVVALLQGALAMLPGCGVAGDRLSDYLFRLPVEINTPEGGKTGSSVIEVSTAVAGRNSIPTPGAVSHRVRGEAVTVDFGARGMLFALLRSDDKSDWASDLLFRLAPRVPSDAFKWDGKYDANGHFKAQFEAMLKMREPIEIPRTFPPVGHLKNQLARPMLVRFANIADPKTVEQIGPDDLVASFGPGVKLRRITVQITDDPVTTGIENRLEWLDAFRNKHFDGTASSSANMTSTQFTANMTAGSFSTEFAR